MALSLGTNCGFVTTAPVADPTDTNTTINGRCRAMLDTTPAGIGKITEIGFWLDDAVAADFDIGVYTDAGASEPETRLHVAANEATGGTAGWKSVTVDWAVDPETDYWIAIQVDDEATTRFDYNASGPAKTAALFQPQTALPSDWGTSDGTDTAAIAGIYAVVEATAAGSALPLVNAMLLS